MSRSARWRRPPPPGGGKVLEAAAETLREVERLSQRGHLSPDWEDGDGATLDFERLRRAAEGLRP